MMPQNPYAFAQLQQQQMRPQDPKMYGSQPKGMMEGKYFVYLRLGGGRAWPRLHDVRICMMSKFA